MPYQDRALSLYDRGGVCPDESEFASVRIHFGDDCGGAAWKCQRLPPTHVAV